jgi:hypothetical protein
VFSVQETEAGIEIGYHGERVDVFGGFVDCVGRQRQDVSGVAARDHDLYVVVACMGYQGDQQRAYDCGGARAADTERQA